MGDKTPAFPLKGVGIAGRPGAGPVMRFSLWVPPCRSEQGPGTHSMGLLRNADMRAHGVPLPADSKGADEAFPTAPWGFTPSGPVLC